MSHDLKGEVEKFLKTRPNVQKFYSDNGGYESYLRNELTLLVPSDSLINSTEDDVLMDNIFPNLFISEVLQVSDFSSPVTTTSGSNVIVHSPKRLHYHGKLAIYEINSWPSVSDEVQGGAARRKVRRGGADLSHIARTKVFEDVLHAYCVTERDAAGDFIVNLHCYLVENHPDLAALVASQCSSDSLASLAIILQPYRVGSHYIPDDVLSEFGTFVSGGDSDSALKKWYNADKLLFVSLALDAPSYKDLVASQCSEDAVSSMMKVKQQMSKVTTKSAMFQLLKDVMETTPSYLPEERKGDSALNLMEAELRVLSAITHEKIRSNVSKGDHTELASLYRTCNLNKPWLCSNENKVASMSKEVFYSTIHLILRSDACHYMPNSREVTDDNLKLDSTFVSLNSYVACWLEEKIKSSHESWKSLHDAINKRRK